MNGVIFLPSAWSGKRRFRRSAAVAISWWCKRAVAG